MRDKNKRKNRSGGSYLMLLLLAVFLLGFITGVVVWSRSYTAGDIERFNLDFCAYCTGRGLCRNFTSALLSYAPYYGLLLISAFFAFGWIVAPAVIFIRAMGLGVCICCLCWSGEVRGVFIAAAVLVIPSIISAAGLLLTARDSIRISGGMFLRMRGRGDLRLSVMQGLARMLVYMIPAVIASLIQAGACRIAAAIL